MRRFHSLAFTWPCFWQGFLLPRQNHRELLSGMQAQIRGHRSLYQGNTPADLVEAMRDDNPYPEADAAAFMAAYSFRMKQWDGSQISTTCAEEFVRDLAQAGELRVWHDLPIDS